MKIEIKKINIGAENQREPKNVIEQIKKIIDSEETLRLKLLAKIDYTNWKEKILRSTWEEAKNYGNQILALILIHQELIVAEKAMNDEEKVVINKSRNRLEELI